VSPLLVAIPIPSRAAFLGAARLLVSFVPLQSVKGFERLPWSLTLQATRDIVPLRRAATSLPRPVRGGAAW
jgi:hypothetical protein